MTRLVWFAWDIPALAPKVPLFPRKIPNSRPTGKAGHPESPYLPYKLGDT